VLLPPLPDITGMETTNVVPLRRTEASLRRISVATILALSFGALVLVSVGGVLALTVSANYANTFDLLGKSANLLIGAMDDSLRARMDRAQDAVAGVGALYEAGRFDIDDAGAMTAVLSGALASVPDASAMLIYDRDFSYRGVGRPQGKDGAPAVTVIEKKSDTPPDIRKALEIRQEIGGLRWGDLALFDGHIYANVSLPLMRQGKVDGWVVAPIDLLTLSAITRDLSGRFGTTAFIIDGDDRILAHPRLLQPRAAGWANEPTVPLSEFDDPVLAHYAERKPIEGFSAAGQSGAQFSEIRLDSSSGPPARQSGSDPGYIVITKTVTGYGPRPWTIGAYFTRRALGDEIMRVWLSAAVGGAGLVLALIAALLLGKRLARPIKAIAAQAHLVADFDLDSVRPLPRSRVLEFDHQATAFNGMLTGLRAFSGYVPRSLVARLVRTGDADITRPREAIVTVMFTDIAGFTSLAEHLPANAGAELLNHHFGLLCGAIDAAGGTVDKFLGDGVMAFFGAPDRLKGHAAAAVRAAVAIRAAVMADNRAAAAEGRPTLRMRIGIHTGRVIVGDIGASDRVNYTIVGDTVNVSQRLQGLGKLLAPDAEVAIVISGETAARLDDSVALTASGRHRLRGRGEPIEVFLVGEAADADLAGTATARVAQEL
jgi:adenylate cyclase